MQPPRSLPQMTFYKPRGMARVRLNGHSVYLGPWGSDQAQQRYDEVIAQWLANDRRWPPARALITSVHGLAARFREHAHSYYRKHGRPTKMAHKIATVADLLDRAPIDPRRPAAGALADLAPEAFGPLALKSFQTYLAADPARRWSRGTINEYAGVVVAMYRWAVTQELLEESLHRQLALVGGLRKGRAPAADVPAPREGGKVGPPQEGAVEKVLPFLPPVVRGMVEVQLLTGMRPEEVCALRPQDLVKTTDPRVVAYRVAGHKLDHLDVRRTVYLGPKALQVLRPWLDATPAAEAPVFSPRRSEELRQAARRATREAPRWPSHETGARRRRRLQSPMRMGERYTPASYRRAIRRACDRFNEEAGAAERIRPWFPYQLRHAAASYIAERESIEVARMILGHADIATTQIYVNVAERRAVRAAAKLG